MTIHALLSGGYFYKTDSTWETYQKIVSIPPPLPIVLSSQIPSTIIRAYAMRTTLQGLLNQSPVERFSAKHALAICHDQSSNLKNENNDTILS